MPAPPAAEVEALGEALALKNPYFLSLLVSRGIKTFQEVKDFMVPEIRVVDAEADRETARNRQMAFEEAVSVAAGGGGVSRAPPLLSLSLTHTHVHAHHTTLCCRSLRRRGDKAAAKRGRVGSGYLEGDRKICGCVVRK